jgi:subtilisin
VSPASRTLNPNAALGLARALAAALGALLVLALPGLAHANDEPQSGYVVLYDRSLPSVTRETDGLERSEGFQSERRFGRAVKGFAADLTPEQVRDLRADPQVASVTPDRQVTALGTVPLAAGEQVPTGIGRVDAATGTTAHQAASSAVAVIDTGVDLANPDLDAVTGKDCITPGGTAQDEHGHGTHVAGTIAARNSGSGVVGVAPGTKIYAVKVLNARGVGTLSTLICGIDWVAANAQADNIKVANMSVGSVGPVPTSCATTLDPEYQAVCRAVGAGVTFVAAAGNSGIAFDGARITVPAAYPEVLTVTAMSDGDGQPGGAGGPVPCRPSELDDTAARYSNFASTAEGAAHVIAAPGTCIASSAIGGGVAMLSGTSMATPHVAGSVALCLGDEASPGPCAGLTPAEIIDRMRADAAAHTTEVPAFGFVGDLANALAGRSYGSLVWDGFVPPPPPAPADSTPAGQATADTSPAGTPAADTPASGAPPPLPAGQPAPAQPAPTP